MTRMFWYHYHHSFSQSPAPPLPYLHPVCIPHFSFVSNTTSHQRWNQQQMVSKNGSRKFLTQRVVRCICNMTFLVTTT
jgi:hypothetical protein